MEQLEYGKCTPIHCRARREHNPLQCTVRCSGCCLQYSFGRIPMDQAIDSHRASWRTGNEQHSELGTPAGSCAHTVARLHAHVIRIQTTAGVGLNGVTTTANLRANMRADMVYKLVPRTHPEVRVAPGRTKAGTLADSVQIVRDVAVWPDPGAVSIRSPRAAHLGRVHKRGFGLICSRGRPAWIWNTEYCQSPVLKRHALPDLYITWALCRAERIRRAASRLHVGCTYKRARANVFVTRGSAGRVGQGMGLLRRPSHSLMFVWQSFPENPASHRQV